MYVCMCILLDTSRCNAFVCMVLFILNVNVQIVHYTYWCPKMYKSIHWDHDYEYANHMCDSLSIYGVTFCM